jgi:hypothetical protein
MSTPDKPWPVDFVIVVCSRVETAKRDHHDSYHHTTCRDCNAPIGMHGRTRNFAQAESEKCGLPVEALCQQCAMQYELTHGLRADNECRLIQRVMP